MQLTIISGENVASLEVASDIELENFLALCSVELTPIANTQFDKLLITYNGRQMTPNEAALKKKLQELDFNEGDVVHIDVVSVSKSHSSATSSTRAPQQKPSITSLISNLVQGIKVPTKRPMANDQENVMADNLFALCSDPIRLDYLRAEHPELAAAFEANPNDQEAFRASWRHFKDEMARRARVMQDESSEEGQRYVAEMIARQNIEFMHEFAMEHMPEAFIPVHMLYIRMTINNHPVIAFVDSGAQTSILSESCAKRCNVFRYVDRRYRANAVGIGGSQKMVGRIHSCQVQVYSHIFPCPFEVMADRDIDILFGLNTLLRHKCQIDLQNMVLRFGDGTETPFLSEAEYTQEKDAVRQDEAATTKTEDEAGKSTE